MLSFDFEKNKASCIWLVGSDCDTQVVWNCSSFVQTEVVQEVEVCSLFDSDQVGLKSVYSSALDGFLKSSERQFWSRKLLIKVEADKKSLKYKNVVSNQDFVLDLASFSKKTLFEAFCLFQKVNFDDRRWQFVLQNCENLQHVFTCSLLNSCKINLVNWGQFLNAGFNIKGNWAQKFRNKTLLTEALVKDDMIAALYYSLYAQKNVEKKALLQFLISSIKDGAKVWDMNVFWKDLICDD